MLGCHACSADSYERFTRFTVERVEHIGGNDSASQVIYPPHSISGAKRLDGARAIRGIDHRSCGMAFVQDDEVPAPGGQELRERVVARRVVVHDDDERDAALPRELLAELEAPGLVGDRAAVQRDDDAVVRRRVLRELPRPDRDDGERAEDEDALLAGGETDRDACLAYSASPHGHGKHYAPAMTRRLVWHHLPSLRLGGA